MKLKNIISKSMILGMAALTIVFFQNCDGGLNEANNNKIDLNQLSDGLDDGLVNSAPKIDCMISSTERNSVYQRISTFNDEFSNLRFDEDDTLEINCSNTGDENPDQLIVEIDSDYNSDNPNFKPISSAQESLGRLSVGMHNIAVKITDEENQSSIKTSTVVVTCNSSAPAPKVNDPLNSIGVKETSVSIYDYSVTNVSGGTGFEYAFDFNGDGIFDPIKKGSNNIWSKSANVNNVYSNLIGDRPIMLKVRNDCMKETEVLVNKNLETTHDIARNEASLALEKDYYYIQSDIVDLESDSNELEKKRRDNVEFLGTNQKGVSKFTCDINNKNNVSTLTINTNKKYRSEGINEGGMLLKVINIPDDGSPGSHMGANTYGVASVSELRYSAPGLTDGIAQDIYTKNGACRVKLRLTRSKGSRPCRYGSDAEAETIQVLGEFNCDNLSNSQADNVRINNGKFYCEKSIVDKCVGGGGSGGGTPPPQY